MTSEIEWSPPIRRAKQTSGAFRRNAEAAAVLTNTCCMRLVDHGQNTSQVAICWMEVAG